METVENSGLDILRWASRQERGRDGEVMPKMPRVGVYTLIVPKGVD